MLTATTSALCELHEAVLLLAIRTCLNIHLMSKNAVNKGTAKAALTQMLSAVNIRMETLDLKMKSETDENAADVHTKKNLEAEGNVTEDGVDEGHDISIPFLSIAHKDAFLVFRALCKLSS